MGFKQLATPRLPQVAKDVDATYITGLVRSLNAFFAQVVGASQLRLSSSGQGTANVVTGLSFNDPTATGVSLPTQADLANLRSGDVYYDTSANNVLKVKP